MYWKGKEMKMKFKINAFTNLFNIITSLNPIIEYIRSQNYSYTAIKMFGSHNF